MRTQLRDLDNAIETAKTQCAAASFGQQGSMEQQADRDKQLRNLLQQREMLQSTFHLRLAVVSKIRLLWLGSSDDLTACKQATSQALSCLVVSFL